MWSTTARKARVPLVWVASGTNPPRVKLGPEHWTIWEAVQSDGYDLLVCDAQGAILPHQRESWSYSGRTATIRADITSGWSLPSGATVGVLYLYAGAAAAVAVDPSVTVSGSTITGAVGVPGPLDGVLVDGLAVAADGNGTAPVAQVDAPVGGRLTVLLPVPVTLAAQPVLGGREIEDVAGLLVQVLDADSDSDPTTPADWWEDSDVRLHYDPERGPVVAVIVTATEADPALLRVRAYLGGTSTLSLPTRTTTLWARLRGVAPTE